MSSKSPKRSKRQVCQICGAENPVEERTCAICGARLTGQAPVSSVDVPEQSTRSTGFYNFSLGEDDLMASQASGIVVLAAVFVVIGMVIAGLIYLGVQQIQDRQQDDGLEIAVVPSDTHTPDLTFTALALTPRATRAATVTRTQPPPLPTVTPPPTDTPLPGPCEFQVKEGDSLLGFAIQCGYLEYDGVIDEIVAFNELPSAAALQIGQIIQVPRPSPTIDPLVLENPAAGAVNEETVNTSSEGNSDGVFSTVSADDIILTSQVENLPTLDPNLQYYTVQQGDTLYSILAVHNIDAKLLSEINPEIEFLQCDFGQQGGGPNCAVFLSVGQQVRVPAPTPTATIPPTASGSETPTPSPTATINVPAAFAPEQGAEFDAASMITLRWTTTGTLGENEVYAVHVTELEAGKVWTGITCDLAFDLPPNWQSSKNEFVEFEWYITVADVSPFGTEDDVFDIRATGYDLCRFAYDLPVEWEDSGSSVRDLGRVREAKLGDERFPTTPRRFLWQGRPR